MSPLHFIMPEHNRRHRLVGLLVLTILAALALALGSGGTALADGPPLDAKAFNAQIAAWMTKLNTQEKALADDDVTNGDLDQIHSVLQTIRDGAQAQMGAAKTQKADKTQLLGALGPAPAKGAPPETHAVAKQRATLITALSHLNGRIKRAGVVQTRAESLMRSSLEAARTRAAQRLMRHDIAPFALWLWQGGLAMLNNRLEETVKAPEKWWRTPNMPAKVGRAAPTIALVIVLAVIIAWPIRRWLIRVGGPGADDHDPTYARKVWSAACLGLGRGVLPIFAVLSIYIALELHGLLTPDIIPLAKGATIGVILYLTIAAIGWAAFSPGRPDWQLTPVSPDSARRQARTITLLAVIIGLNSFLWSALRIYEGEQTTALRAIITLISTVVLALTAWPLTRDNAWILAQDGETDDAPATAHPILAKARWLVRILFVVAIITATTGYYNLADYITRNILLLWLLFSVYHLATVMMDELIAAILVAETGLLSQFRRGIGIGINIDEEHRRIVNFWLCIGANLLIFCLLVFAYLPSLGVPMAEITTFLGTVGSGLTIGSIHISFVDIALSVVIFLGLARLTHSLQKFLEQKLLPQTRLDEGVRNSVQAATGYIGMTITTLIAVSIAGIDLRNIALIAGALSVGIGFGLQNVVNNFISGLIVLVERPVKVGDWIRVGDHEGTVKRINVRATEIETFRRVSVVVPNGDLISQPIINYTFKNKLGRLDIPVPIAGYSDIDQVQQILLSVATEHKKVLSYPQPMVILINFSAAALNFELRCYVANIEDGYTIRSEIMMTLAKTLRAAQVELPEDIVWDRYNLAELDRIEGMLGRVFGSAQSPGPFQSTPKPEVTPVDATVPSPLP